VLEKDINRMSVVIASFFRLITFRLVKARIPKSIIQLNGAIRKRRILEKMKNISCV
jgi:hypothetical protein